ncbi:hypothetical protein FEM54_24785 [Pseudomonas edaphica]|uniref:DUF2282 domain-containing protein n=1 Tax=Pseudomonas edaphica TaxID=2006980 RepID=A0A5R8QSB5_9PSED|nr:MULTISPECIES: hypothetical protein [Pseudomonas]QLG94218.1 hypothetical protein HZF02_20750 [Pseudomonas yamanorum]MCF5141567.1 hypothetical protein [Pseudomonas sp. PA-6-3C]MCF5148483.1 hypothetical protein [Pseudomonas sp. PA-6-3F]MCF5157256.1 hypothetical protein [Pseudomonas sp. PA-6-2E]MCF5176803.1 hypothetical protein [Pseudomonas sp. PA-6-1D]
MKNTLFALAPLLFYTVAHAADPASVLGHAFGSLSCVEQEDPDGRSTCEARALSNGKGCYGLSSQTMRDKCLDEALYPVSSGEIASKVKKTTLVNPLPSPEKAFTVPPKPLLSEDEIKRLERSFGLKNVPQ